MNTTEASKGTTAVAESDAARKASFGLNGVEGKVIDAHDGSAGFNPSLERNVKSLAPSTEGEICSMLNSYSEPS